MAAPPLSVGAAENRTALPREAELQAFARAAAHLLAERVPRAAGTRVVARRPGIGIQHLDHRDYAPGDEVRHIDWRLTARARRPIVRRFEAESVSDWTIVVDASSSMADAAKWRAAVRAAAAMGYALLQLGHRVGLLAFGSRVLANCPRGRGAPHYASIVRALSTLQPAHSGERSALGVCARHLHGAASVFTVSDFLAEDEMRRDLATLRQSCSTVHALQLTDPADTRLPASGEIDLVDVETAARLPALAGPSAELQAAAERAAMTQRLRAYCARCGIAFTDWDIAQPWQPALIRHLLRAQSNC